jgi:hypothetical protein
MREFVSINALPLEEKKGHLSLNCHRTQKYGDRDIAIRKFLLGAFHQKDRNGVA